MEMRSGCQEKLFYHAYDLALAIESQEGKFGKKHRILKGWREDENDKLLVKIQKGHRERQVSLRYLQKGCRQ